MVFAVTFGTMWLPTLMYKLNVPFVWGPLGGGEGVPEVLWPQLTKKQALIERVRKINKYICLQTRFGIDSADGRFLELYPAEISEQMQHDDRDRRFAGTM